MKEPQQNQGRPDFKTSMNVANALCTIHQRCIVVPFRNHWGKRALGLPCALAFVLMFFWVGFSQDPLMLGWFVAWCLFYVVRRIEAGRLSGQVHSHDDGCPINLGKNERLAKRFFEPLLIGLLGGGLRWFYIEQGWSPVGLPNFLLAGVVSLIVVEAFKKQIWERRIDDMNDARFEQESLLRDYQ